MHLMSWLWPRDNYVFVKDHDCTDGIEKCNFSIIGHVDSKQFVFIVHQKIWRTLTETHLFYHNARNAPNHIKNALGNKKLSHKLFCFHCFNIVLTDL